MCLAHQTASGFEASEPAAAESVPRKLQCTTYFSVSPASQLALATARADLLREEARCQTARRGAQLWRRLLELLLKKQRRRRLVEMGTGKGKDEEPSRSLL